MNIIKLELTEQEAKIYDEVMEQIEKTAAFLCQRHLKMSIFAGMECRF